MTIPQKVKFTKTISDAPSGDSPGGLLCKKGETGYIIKDKGNGWYTAVEGKVDDKYLFTIKDGEFEIIQEANA